MGAFSVDFAEPFGMVFEVFFRGDESIKCVHKPLVGVLAAAFGV